MSDDYIQGIGLSLLSSFLTTALALGLLSIPLRRLPEGTHWSMAAKEFAPVRTAQTFILVWSVLFMWIFSSEPRDFESPPETWQLFLVSCSIVAGCLVGSRVALLGGEIPKTARNWESRMLLIKWVLFPAVPATLLLMLLTWRQGLDWRALVIAAAMLALLLPLCTGTSVVLLKWLRILKLAPGNIQQAGRRLAEREGAPLKSVLTMKLGIVNAFASVWTGDLILTSSALSVLNEEEINCVMAHEIGHLNESRLMRWRRLIILPGLISMGLMPAAASSGQTMAVFGFVAVYIVLRSLAHHHHNRMEVQADTAAVRSQISEGVYARALEKIHAAGLIPADFAAGHPYPSLHDRMISAGVRPDFPRLVPASRRRGVFAALAASAAFLVLWRFLILVAGG